MLISRNIVIYSGKIRIILLLSAHSSLIHTLNDHIIFIGVPCHYSRVCACDVYVYGDLHTSTLYHYEKICDKTSIIVIIESSL